jgi:hypothetical protein
MVYQRSVQFHNEVLIYEYEDDKPIRTKKSKIYTIFSKFKQILCGLFKCFFKR